MGTDLTLLIILLLSPAIMLTVHMAGARAFRERSPQLVAVFSVLAAAVPTGVLAWWLALREAPPGTPLAAATLYCALSYGGLGYTYFHFFNMSETARRIRILHEIRRAGTLPEKDMTALYKTTDIISLRLARLVALGQLECRNGSYFIKGRMLYWSGRLIVCWRGVLGLKDDGA